MKGYAVHEWGVFTIHPNAEFANAGLAAEWAECPKELYRTEPPNLRNLPYRGPVSKPIIYFHWDAEQPPPEKGAAMKVRFPVGRPVIWWPASEVKPVGQEVTDTLSWRLFLRKPPLGGGPAGKRPRAPHVAADHWYAKARTVKAEPVFSYGGHGNAGTAVDAEQFVYYDGLMKPLEFLAARRTPAGAIVLDAKAPYPLHDLWCIDRTGAEPKLARVPLVPAGERTIDLDWKTVAADDWHAATAEALAADLEQTGLHADEARSLVAIWQPGFFHAPGLTLFYRLPQREYDRVTTITLDPVPETLVRVGIVLHAHAEPEAAEGKPAAEAAPAAGPPAGMKPPKLLKQLTVAEAKALAAADHDLCLFGLSSVSADVVQALAAHGKILRAPGVATLESEMAAAFAAHAGAVELPDLRRLDSPQLAKKLCDVKNFSLPYLVEIGPEAAAVVCASPNWNGRLPALTAFEAADSVAVAKALATRKGPLALPNLKKMSPKTLTALIEKQDVEIPLIETLELIPEPDGSPNDDFVIPEWLEEKQRRGRSPAPGFQ